MGPLLPHFENHQIMAGLVGEGQEGLCHSVINVHNPRLSPWDAASCQSALIWGAGQVAFTWDDDGQTVIVKSCPEENSSRRRGWPLWEASERKVPSGCGHMGVMGKFGKKHFRGCCREDATYPGMRSERGLLGSDGGRNAHFRFSPISSKVNNCKGFLLGTNPQMKG